MDSGNQSEKDLFVKALQFTSLEQRATFLEDACGDDEELRQRIETLVAAHEQSGGFLKEPPAAVSAQTLVITTSMVPGVEKPGDRIGRYKLLQRLGEGGCGVVYMAEQEESVRRRVALKVIKLGMDTKSVIARFEAERQALALMDIRTLPRSLMPALRKRAARSSSWNWCAASRSPTTAIRTISPRKNGSRYLCWFVPQCNMPTKKESSTATSNPRTFWSRCTTACQFRR
jgi:hypothetical protein